MAEQITKEEMKAFADASKEHAIALVQLTCLVEDNSEKLDAVLAVKGDIVEKIVGKSDDGSTTTLIAIKKDTSATNENINRSLFIIGAITLIGVAAAVIANLVVREIQDAKIVENTMSKYMITVTNKTKALDQTSEAVK